MSFPLSYVGAPHEYQINYYGYTTVNLEGD